MKIYKGKYTKPSTKIEIIEKYGEKMWEKQKEQSLKRQKEVRLIALRGYGDKCVNCGITDENVLCIDHVIPIGKNRMLGPRFYYWLIKNNHPVGYQILCHNCNHLKVLADNEYKRLIKDKPTIEYDKVV